MLKNYIVTAFRAMLRNKLASLITILGLALSLVSVFLLALFVQFEISFEAFHEKRDRLCRVIIQGQTYSKDTNYTEVTPVTTGFLLELNFDTLANAVTVAYNEVIVDVGNEAFTEDAAFAEDSFLEMFTFPLMQGDSHTALRYPKSMIITPEVAERYFGETNPVGQTVTIRTPTHPEPVMVTITGIFHNIPRNDSILREILLSFDVYLALQGQVDGGVHAQTYVELLQASMFSEFKDALQEYHLEDLWAESAFETFHLDIERISDIYLYSHIGVPAGSLNPRLLLVSLVLFAAILILVIACINVTNLLIAGFSKRAKEVGLRKVVGAQHSQLIGQFLIEALVLCGLAFVVALMLTEMLLPRFNTLVHRHLTFNLLSNPGFWVAMLGVTLMVGIIAGMYPAFVLAALKPVSTLQGERLPSTRHLRKILVVIQFIASVVLLIASGILAREITFIKNKALGFETRNMLIVDVNVPEFLDRYESFKAELLRLPEVEHITASSSVAWSGIAQLQYPVDIPGTGRIDTSVLLADPDYLETYGIPLLEGSGFPHNQTDSNTILISESAKRAFGWPRISGKAVNLSALADPRSNHGLVVGVVKDFQYVYPMQRPAPLLIVQHPKLYNVHWIYVSIRFHDRVEQSQRVQVEDIWKQFFPTLQFQAELLETRIERQHKENLEPLSASLQAATVFAMFTAYLGLFGLASYETTRRTKEIGIRKALGATSTEIVMHFVKGFVMLALIANVIAWPLAFFLMRLSFRAINYPYPLHMGPLVFLQAGVISVILAIITVSVQTLRAASVNPVNALRYE